LDFGGAGRGVVEPGLFHDEHNPASATVGIVGVAMINCTDTV
jgi:hypothetical protein